MNKTDIDKEKRASIFKNTMQIIKTNKQLSEATKKSKDSTILYKEDDKISIPESPGRAGMVQVIDARTLQACKGMQNVAILNFASATHPGGGVKTGSNAQEECICRCTNLYPCLAECNYYKDFYQYHKDRHNALYTDRILYTKDVTVFKSDTKEPTLLPEEDWYQVDVITCAAPNIRNVKQVYQSDLLQLFKQRIERILQVAIANNRTNIVLGAFGCGAFKNPPFLVARAFKEVLSQYRGYFDNIVFAVLATPHNDENFKAFSKAFNKF